MLVRPDDNDNRIEKLKDASFIKTLRNSLPSTDYVIFNCKAHKNIEIMFYTDYTAYDQSLTETDYDDLKNKKAKLAVIDNGKLPDFINKNNEIIKIKAPDNTW